MTRDDEAYVHFQECLTSLNRAWGILVKLEDASLDATLWTASFHMAIIEYAKPFKASLGANRRRHILPLPHISRENAELHSRLMGLRDQVLAHSDLTVNDAKVYVGIVSGQPMPLLISNTTPPVPTVSAVRQHVEQLLDILYAKIPDYEQKLASPS